MYVIKRSVHSGKNIAKSTSDVYVLAHSNNFNLCLEYLLNYITDLIKDRKLCEAWPTWDYLKLKNGETGGCCECCGEHIPTERILDINNKVCDILEKLQCPVSCGCYTHCGEDHYIEWADEKNNEGRFNLNLYYDKHDKLIISFMESYKDKPTKFTDMVSI